MPYGPHPAERANGQRGGAQLTTVVRGTASDEAAVPATSRSDDSRILRIGYGLVTMNLWLRTAILAAAAVGLIVLAFHWQVISKPAIPSFLAAQLGTGLLIGAVGAALVQAFIMSAPQTMHQLVQELRAQSRESTLENRLGELTAELRAHDLRTRTVAGDSLSRLGVVDVLTTTEALMPAMSAALTDPALTEIRLLGISLSSWFSGRRRSRGADWPGERLERLLLGKDPDLPRTSGIRVRVLLLDPACLSLRLLTLGAEGDASEERGSLSNEIREIADHLSRLGKEVARLGNGNQLQVRFYRAVPPFFLFAAGQGVFMRSYYHGLADNPQAGASAVWHFGAESAANRATCRHFDALWDTDSVPCEEVLLHKSIGTDQGIGESGIINIYTDRESAQERIRWLITHARRRVWIQGVSLRHHLSPPLEEAMLHLVQTSSIDTRVLILDPESDQALRKSYRDYLLDRAGAAIEYDEYVRDGHLHRGSRFYARLKQSAQGLADMSAQATDGNFQLRQYACAPTSYVLIADDHALIEQFHYGKPVNAGDSIKAQLQLAREMPLIEYTHPGSGLFAPKPMLDPLAVIEDHFSHVFEHFGSGVSPIA
jgi:hypothetical protein